MNGNITALQLLKPEEALMISHGLEVSHNNSQRYINILSIDPGYANMGAAWLIYDRQTRGLCVSNIAIWNVGNKKSKDDDIMDSVAHLLLQNNVRDWVHMCILEKQGGVAQRKVIRVEQHIATLLRYGLNKPVYIYNPRLRNKAKPKDMKTSVWLTTQCRQILALRAQSELMTTFNALTAKQKTDVGAAIVQVETLFDTLELI